MTDKLSKSSRPPSQYGLPEKRQAIFDAARAVFLRDGFSRASVDAIAAVANVSKRTIYNHFTDKEQLFTSIVETSSEAASALFTTAAEQHLTVIDDLEQDLIDFGMAWLTPKPADAEHSALVRLVIAEATHHPGIVRAWHAAGPRRTRHELASRFEDLSERGLLTFDDANEAAGHFIALVHSPVGERSFYGALPLTSAEVDQIVTTGVRAFLRIYGT